MTLSAALKAMMLYFLVVFLWDRDCHWHPLLPPPPEPPQTPDTPNPP